MPPHSIDGLHMPVAISSWTSLSNCSRLPHFSLSHLQSVEGLMQCEQMRMRCPGSKQYSSHARLKVYKGRCCAVQSDASINVPLQAS